MTGKLFYVLRSLQRILLSPSKTERVLQNFQNTKYWDIMCTSFLHATIPNGSIVSSDLITGTIILSVTEFIPSASGWCFHYDSCVIRLFQPSFHLQHKPTQLACTPVPFPLRYWQRMQGSDNIDNITGLSDNTPSSLHWRWFLAK